MDEPSAALDDDTEHAVISSIINHVREQHKTVVMVTHAKNIAREFADIIVTISQGRVVDKEVQHG